MGRDSRPRPTLDPDLARDGEGNVLRSGDILQSERGAVQFKAKVAEILPDRVRLELIESTPAVEWAILTWVLRKSCLRGTSWVKVGRDESPLIPEYGRVLMKLARFTTRQHEVSALKLERGQTLPREIKAVDSPDTPKALLDYLASERGKRVADRFAGWFEGEEGPALVEWDHYLIYHEGGRVEELTSAEFDSLYAPSDVAGNEDGFVEAIKRFADEVHLTAKAKGFWPESGRNDAEMIALMHSELSEALEALRAGNLKSEKCPGFTQVEEELADLLIRVFDFAGGRKLNIGAACLAKAQYNKSRPMKHGKAF